MQQDHVREAIEEEIKAHPFYSIGCIISVHETPSYVRVTFTKGELSDRVLQGQEEEIIQTFRDDPETDFPATGFILYFDNLKQEVSGLFCVSPPHQKKGHAKELVTMMEAIAKNVLGYRSIRVLDPHIPLFSSMGYTIENMVATK